MNVREMLEVGLISQLRNPEMVIKENVDSVLDDIIPEDNYFMLKCKDRLWRMEKSNRARTHRHMIREIKQRRHSLGFHP